MRVLHITPETDGYEEADLIANRVSPTNHMSVIEINGKQFITGGYILLDVPEVRKILDSVPKNEQYKLVYKLRSVPFEKSYL